MSEDMDAAVEGIDIPPGVEARADNEQSPPAADPEVATSQGMER